MFSGENLAYFYYKEVPRTITSFQRAQVALSNEKLPYKSMAVWQSGFCILPSISVKSRYPRKAYDAFFMRERNVFYHVCHANFFVKTVLRS